ncbi:type II secretion system protein [Sporolactobacillus sp. KGMB 08714]|uniref:type II secretion system protein n=1 Tax=Sporolactobacillus sp. KGMB 08714 TaxID=3064704 RepID=UPI002FBE1F85
MIHNSRGMTLVEMLAVLTIASVCFALIFAIWLSGEKSAGRTLTENDLQADANLVQSRLTQAFFNKNNRPFSVSVSDGKVEIKYDSADQAEIISSENLSYSGSPSSMEVNQGTNQLEINYTISPRNVSGNSALNFQINTALNYPWNDSGGGQSH